MTSRERSFWTSTILCISVYVSLCEVPELLTPSQRGQPRCSATGALVSVWLPAECQAEQETAAKVWAMCIVRRRKKGYSPGLAIFLPIDVCGEDACAPWVHSLCVPVDWVKKMNLQKCNVTASNTRYSGRIKFLYTLGAEPWLSSTGEECAHHGAASCWEAVSKQHKVCCTSENPVFVKCRYILISHLSTKSRWNQRLPVAWRKGAGGLEGSTTPISTDAQC